MKHLNDPFSPTPEGFHRRVEQTLNGLEEREMTKRKFSVGVAIALAVLLITATALAASAVLSGGYVDSTGTYHDYSDPDADPERTPPDPEDFPDTSIRDALFENMPRGEEWRLLKDGAPVEGGRCSVPLRYDYSEEVLALLKDTPLCLPPLPEDCIVPGVLVFTAVKPEPFETFDLEDGLTVVKYRLTDPADGQIESVSFHGFFADESYFNISAEIVASCDDLDSLWSMYVSGEGIYQPLEIPGWDRAVWIEDGGVDNVLFLGKRVGERLLWYDVQWEGDFTQEFFIDMFSS